ncbi:MAG: LutC/YkgG family protein [Actinomycetes bacterium]
MAVNARDEVLSRVRHATRTPSAPLSSDVGIPSSPAPTSAPSPATAASVAGAAAAERDGARSRDTIELFVERVRDYRAQVVEVPASEVAGAVARLLDESHEGHEGQQVHEGQQAQRSRVVAPPGVPDEWLAALDPDRLHRDQPVLSVDELDAAAAVITGAAVGIAETGTIVLDGSSDQGRRALTLVPDHHIVVISQAQVVRDVRAAIAALSPTRPLTFISGPSATSDLELSRVEGGHGPRRLDVVVLTKTT